MAKNIKLNIKNAQLAEALNIGKKLSATSTKAKTAKTKKPATKKAPAKSEVPAEKEALKKPKARILPPAEKEAVAKKAEEKKMETKPKAKVIKEKTEIGKEPSAEKEPAETLKKESPSEEIVVLKKTSPIIEEVSEDSSKPAKRRIDLSKVYPQRHRVPKNVTIPEKNFKTETPKKEEKRVETKEVKPLQPAKPALQKPVKKVEQKPSFDNRYRMGLRTEDERENVWRKRRPFHKKRKSYVAEEDIIRPKTLHIRIPIIVKDLASEMKLKASQIISKLFLQGMVVTLNDVLDDETTVQLIGHEFDCEITIDTSAEDRLQITSESIDEEIAKTPKTALTQRPPVITFMGHVDHGKTSLIDAIRESNIAAGEAGAITQHIGAFSAKTPTGTITILDTPGHEAFDEMRERGAHATDMVILVIAGDEGMRDQTIEALNHAKAAKVPIIVAINKSDKQGFDSEKVYRQLSDHELLPEAWGGSIITVNCSAITKDGISDLLEMISLQAEVLELKANVDSRARGTILESQMHKGLGAVATVLVQNGTLRIGDPIVFGSNWGRVKTIHDQYNKSLEIAGPSTPIKVTGLSDLAQAGCEFIVIPTEKEARSLAHDRKEVEKKLLLQRPKSAKLDTFLSDNKEAQEMIYLPLIIRCDVQGSLEALKTALNKIPSKKAGINFVSASVGEISESDIELAAASKATIIGFHTRVESHAEPLIKQLKTDVRLHTIIYHAIDEAKVLMQKLLPKISEEKDTGTAEVIAIFKSSQLGRIAGCKVTKGLIKRDHRIRVIRNEEVIFDGKVASLKRVKEDVREVQKGIECGILIQKFSDFEEGDVLQAYEIIYHEQTL